MTRQTRRPATAWIAIALTVLAGLGSAGCSADALSRRHIKRGNHSFEQRKYSQAIAEYRNALRRNPTNDIAIRQLGRAYFQAGDLRRAHPFLVKAKEMNPADMDVRVKLETLYARAGRAEKARAEAEYVLRRSPESLEGLLLLSESAVTLAQRQEALQGLEKRRGHKRQFKICEAKDKDGRRTCPGSTTFC